MQQSSIIKKYFEIRLQYQNNDMQAQKMNDPSTSSAATM